MLMRVFGKEVWKKVVVVLIFVNLIEDFDGGDEKVYFEGEFNYWKDVIYDFLCNDFEFYFDFVLCDLFIFLIDLVGNY